MAVNERTGAQVMAELDTQFFAALERFRMLAEALGERDRYHIEYGPEYRPVAIWLDGERYLVNPSA